MPATKTAFQLLLEIDQRCRSLAAGLPLQDTRQQDWTGIGFRMGEHCYVAPMGEIGEILHEPRYAVLPGVKPWVKGVANLRGRLLPIMDLCAFFGQDLSPLRKERRVLVIEHQEVFVGLLVDEVLGMQHFNQRSLMPEALVAFDADVAPFIRGQFLREQAWLVFSPRALAQSPGFMDIAL
ncbi:MULTISPECIES: chemotaxis protein CheW [unclassified Pseudomonas]|uniref:chemotaxis protein CheW n=1 Tax=unclassified Pseudomonas TaxID=196821 RepID=UPI002AC8ABB6|nr:MULTISPECIES: chemotaxis protein CheW [unclassified Pseudomonas]MEB0039408.1 chemotaxis protein CheW [Pseudomonas sp. MH10]MEB0079286.1 chemotaxis protein CheW [Pseudomonas sp. MH10out]MEB0092601.1 chemotaxis protein CheW [Pseudomonas sp. CCI4.2]MEB0102559.1 chemotaxis protein CheW [Pseudomonas sp. CCI3.2]MEB0119151.1 chemotaxis protein CheW [Pseudomonas sp. CCI1.2]